jgi:hypothetical protein
VLNILKSTSIKGKAFLLLFLFSSAAVSAQDFDYTDTLSLSNRKIMKGFSALDSVVGDKEVFIAGENHTYRGSNSKLWMQNIKYLYEHAGVRNVIMESGLSTSWLANEYVQTGDTVLFNIIDQYVYKEYAERYKQLYRFNRDLDSNQKVQIFGIDLERGSFGALKVLSLLIPDSVAAPDSIDMHIESILGMAMYQDREIFDGDEDESYSYTYSVRNTLQLVIANFKNNDSLYRDYLTDKYDLFRKILYGLDETIKWRDFDKKSAVQGYIFREKYMYNRFVDLLDSNPGKYYGQFGRCHATKKKADKNSCEWYVFKSFANRLKQSKKLNLEGKIVTYGIIYGEDEDYDEDDWKAIEDHMKSVFKNLEANRVMLYELSKDSVLAEFFAEDFDYLFLNTYKPSDNNPYESDYYFGDDSESEDGKFTIAYAYGLQDMALSTLGDLHQIENQSKYDEYTVWQGLDIVFGSESIVSTSNFALMTPINSTEFDSFGTVNTSLNGFAYSSYLQYNALPKVKFMDILFGGSLGYSVLNFKIEETTENAGPVTSGFLGNIKKSVYSNPAFTGRLSVGIDFNIGHVTVGGRVGSVFDFSSTDWRLDGDLIDNGPKTSLGGIYGNAHIGLNFDI